MDTADLTKAGIAAAVAVAVAHFAPWQPVKAAAYGIAGVIVASRLPVIGDALTPSA